MKCKSKRTKACEIKPSVKQKVWERQNGRSIFSGVPITVSECCCHYVSRSKGGLGIEENILGMTWNEHRIFDNNVVGASFQVYQKMREMARNHLKENYPGWNEESLVYRK